MSVKIQDKKFLKMLKSTIIDFEYMPLNKDAHKLLDDMRQIYRTKTLSVVTVMDLIPYLSYALNNDLRPAIMTSEEARAWGKIRREHKYMFKVLHQHFTYKEMSMGGCFISEKH